MPLDPLILAGATIGAAVLAPLAVRAIASRRWRLAAIRKAAASLGLEYVPPDLFGNGAGLHGVLDHLSINAAVTLPGFEVIVEGNIPRGLQIGPHRDDLVSDDAGSTGDPVFDAAFSVDPQWHGYGVLDARARAKAIALVRLGAHLEVASGRLVVDAPPQDRDFESLVRDATELATLLSRAQLPPSVLANLDPEERSPLARLEELSAMMGHSGAADAEKAAAETGTLDPAARQLLGRLQSLPDAGTLPAGSASRLAQDVASVGGALGAAAVRRLASAGAGVETMFALISAARDSVTARAALARIGEIGEARVIERLHALADGDAAVAGAAREAIASIRARLKDASEGDLSLAEPAEGAGDLALAGEERGRLSSAVETKPFKR